MMTKFRFDSSLVFYGVLLAVCVGAGMFGILPLIESQATDTVPVATDEKVKSQPESVDGDNAATSNLDILYLIKDITGKTERRSLENKIMVRESIRNVRAIMIILIVAVILLPVSLLIVGTRLLRIFTQSKTVSDTLLLLEQRQTKLAETLRELEQELEMLEYGSVPAVKGLLETANEHIGEAERDLKALKDR